VVKSLAIISNKVMPFRSRVRASCALATMLALAAAMLGCGEQATYPVRGTVRFEGKPLVGGGSIRFAPLDENASREAGGDIAKDGTYLLRTYSESDGAIPGRYRVEIIQNPILQPAVYPEVQLVPGAEPAPVQPTTPEIRVAPSERIPAVYAGAASPLEAVVEKKANEGIDFDLKRQP
jgi:hypothetical protein